jgi:hypothetical protein
MVGKTGHKIGFLKKSFIFINIYCCFEIQNDLLYLTPFWLYEPPIFPLRTPNHSFTNRQSLPGYDLFFPAGL